MKSKKVKQLLRQCIRKIAEQPALYSFHPGIDFTRTRKLPLEKLILSLIVMSGGTLSSELSDLFHDAQTAPSASAFVQQRNKLKPDALEALLRLFSSKLTKHVGHEMRILSVDGSDLNIFPDPSDPDSYYPGANGQKPYGLLHINALYDLSNHVFMDTIVQKRKKENENQAFCALVDRSAIRNALVIADRGYESYNNMAHVQEKGWFFLFRIKDGKTGIKCGLNLPDEDAFDLHIHLQLTRKQSKEIRMQMKDKNHYRFIPSNVTFDFLPLTSYRDPPSFYSLRFRIVRFRLSNDSFETVVTNLPVCAFPPDILKALYAQRWGIETSFKHLKHAAALLNLHSKKMVSILQEIFARMILFNFVSAITLSVIVKKACSKYTYKANFTVAIRLCRAFFLGDVSPPVLEALIVQNLIPIRPDRHYDRKVPVRTPFSFLYRIT